jgi:hypothetical protein
VKYTLRLVQRAGVVRFQLCYSPNVHHRLGPLIDLQPSLFVIGVAAIAAPFPLLGLEHQSAPHRIAMHVAQVLDPLALAPRIEIVEAALPDMWLFRTKLALA